LVGWNGIDPFNIAKMRVRVHGVCPPASLRNIITRESKSREHVQMSW